MIALVLAASFLAAPAFAKDFERLESKDGLVLTFHASPVSNLVYHLDCLVDNAACTKPAFRAFWDARDWNPGDKEALGRWAVLMNKYGKQIDLDEGASSDESALPTPSEMIDLRRKLRIASFRAETWDEYAANLGLLMNQGDVREALSVAARFRPRFEKWWEVEGRKRSERAAEGLLALVKKEDLASFYGKAARFYGYAYPPGTVVEFDLMAQPDNEAKHSSGEQVYDHSVVEIVPEEDIKHRVDVVSHELFHYFYDAAPRSVRRRMLADFADASEPYAYAAFGLLNESVATALGQGLVSRKVLSAEEFARFFNGENALYAESEVNDAAKALVPVLDGAFARGVTISQAEFVEDFIEAVSSGVGPRLSSPAAWFRACSLVEGRGMGAAKEHFQDLAHSNSVWGSSFNSEARRPFLLHSGLSGALFLRPEEVPRLDAWPELVSPKELSVLQTRAKGGKPFVYGLKRSDKAYLYVFVGSGAAALSPVIDDFFKSPAMSAGFRE